MAEMWEAREATRRGLQWRPVAEEAEEVRIFGENFRDKRPKVRITGIYEWFLVARY